MSADEKERFGQYILRLFTDDRDVFGLNVFTATWARVGPEGTIWQDTMLNTRALTPEMTDHRVSTLFAHAGYLYGLTVQEELQPMARTTHNLVVVSLNTGEGRVLDDVPILCVSPYKDGQLLLLAQGPEEAQPRLMAFEPETLAASSLPGRFPEAGEYNGLAYDANMGSIYVAIPGALLKAAPGQDFALHSGLPFDFLVGGQPGAVLDSGHYALRLMSVALIPTGDGEAGTGAASLRLRGQALLDPGLQAFRSAHPGVVLQWDRQAISAAAAGALVQGGDTETDIFLLSLDPALHAMLRKGYGADLDASPRLQAEFSGLYPAIQAALSSPEGRPLAYPLGLSAYHPTVDTPLWRCTLGEAPFPRTYQDFLEAMQRFTGLDGSARPEAYFVADEDALALMGRILRSYVHYYEVPGEALLKLEQNARQEKASGFSPQQILGTEIADEDIRPELFNLTTSSLRGGFAVNETGFTSLAPFTFSMDQEPRFAGFLQVLVINPRSPNLNLALALAETLAGREIDPVAYALLHPGANEPVPNPRGEEAIAADRAALNQAREQLQTARDKKASQVEITQLEQAVKHLQQAVDNSGQRKWLLSQQQLDSYRQVAGQIHFFEQSLLLTEEGTAQMDRLLKRYGEGQLTLDLFLAELDNMARLIFNEQR